MSDQEQGAVAIKAALTAALPAGVQALDLDELPDTHGNSGNLPPRYVLVFVSRRWVPGRRASGEVDLPGGRVVTRYCDSQYVANVRKYRRITAATLEDKTFTLADGSVIGPFSFEVEDAIRETSHGWSGADTWTF